MTVKSASFRRMTAAALLAASLAGCTTAHTTLDDVLGYLVTTPGKYTFYNWSCTQLADTAAAGTARQKVLLGLMAKAGPELDGRLVSAMVYRPEYISIHGDMNELRRAAVANKCKIPSTAGKFAGHAKLLGKK